MSAENQTPREDQELELKRWDSLAISLSLLQNKHYATVNCDDSQHIQSLTYLLQEVGWSQLHEFEWKKYPFSQTLETTRGRYRIGKGHFGIALESERPKLTTAGKIAISRSRRLLIPPNKEPNTLEPKWTNTLAALHFIAQDLDIPDFSEPLRLGKSEALEEYYKRVSGENAAVAYEVQNAWDRLAEIFPDGPEMFTQQIASIAS